MIDEEGSEFEFADGLEAAEDFVSDASPGTDDESGGTSAGALAVTEAVAATEVVPVDPVAAGEVTRYSKIQTRRARELLSRLYATRRAARFYPVEHPAVGEGILAILESVALYHAEGVDVQLGFFEGEIVLGEQLLTEESLQFDQLVRDMAALDIGSIYIYRGVAEDEMRRVIKILALDSAEIEQAGGLETLSRTMGLNRVVLGALRVVERVGEDSGTGGEEIQLSYNGAVSLMREIERLMKSNKQVGSSKVKGVVRSLVDNVLANRYAMLQLTGLKNHDEYTFYHSANVAILSLALGSSISNDYRFLSSLGVGALLHDLGKMGLDNEILNKPGALNPDEWANVRLHPVHGAQMVSVLPGVDKASIVTILEHHMRFDGAGYPTRVPPRRQHLTSRIVAVADSYDAMTSRRSYSAARVQDEAMSLLAKSAGSSLDPVLVRLFIRLMGVYPPRSVVRMSGGEVAVVMSPSGSDPTRPVIRVIASPGGDFIEPAEIDLMSQPQMSISGCIDPRLLNIDVDSYFV
ncbi:MAG: hypothetical protein CVT67_03635 [Actinobacteria bacterium HGW-Actinobacteria-7]|jgi:HD-GYP domain-containing protein (c-di-GMP phosphodiesterase class II)|nr:MAG: hypothetical protein CVT67_03635 [Actinobacteria bacterium HGW-Actinobacteria-7]